MKNFNQFHPYHIVNPSPWPYTMSVYVYLLTNGTVIFMYYNIKIFTLVSLFGIIFVMFSWFWDIIIESTFQGNHTKRVVKGLKIGFILFVLSEVMLFFSFFWAFFHCSLSPSIEIGIIWPPIGITPINPFGIPLLNTAILLSSGATVTWAHYAIIANKRDSSLKGLRYTIYLGIVFTLFQIFEYFESPFSIADSVYGSCFFILTGFHGFHVFVGTVFLTVCFFRHYFFHFTKTHHVGFEAASWYWHFVDVVWIFLFICVYWWGS